jgi:hypothetical protein
MGLENAHFSYLGLRQTQCSSPPATACPLLRCLPLIVGKIVAEDVKKARGQLVK